MDALEVGMRLHAKYSADGEFYPAVVKAVSQTKKRSKAPVQVEFVGYDYKEWKALADLKSKKLREATFPDQLGTIARAHCRDCSVKLVEDLLKQAKEKDALAGKLLLEARLLTSKINSKKNVEAYLKSAGPPALSRAISGENFLRRVVSFPQKSASQLPSGNSAPELIRAVSRGAANFPEGKWPTKVIGVCGMSSSGKSTVTQTLQNFAADKGVYVPVLCMDDSYAEHMFKDPDNEPKKQPTMVNIKPGDRKWKWKNWESPKCMDWAKFQDSLGVQMAIHLGYTPFIIIEGFLMLEHKKIADVCDVIIALDIEKEVAWQRRLGRAVDTAAAVKNGEMNDEDDYEKLKVYAFEKDHADIKTEATSHVESVGKPVVFPTAAKHAGDKDLSAEETVNNYSWLRMYFDEVIWPEAVQVRQHVAEAKAQNPKKIHDINAQLSKADIAAAVSSLISEGKL